METGHVEEICDAHDGRGGTWNEAGVIVFAPVNSGALMRVAAAGGTPEPVTALDGARGEIGHRFPVFLPDGDHFLYATVPARRGEFSIYVGSLTQPSSRDFLLTAQTAPVFAKPDYLLFVRRGGLVAQRFNVDGRKLVAEPVALPDMPDVLGGTYMASWPVSVSATGLFTYLADVPGTTNLIWFDQSGQRSGTVNVPAGRYIDLGLSPDGRRAALLRSTSPTVQDIWLADLERGGATRLTSVAASRQRAVWSPDGDRVAFASDQDGRLDIFVQSAGSAAEESLYRSNALAKSPHSWSMDGRFLVFQEASSATNWDIWLRPMAGDQTAVPYLRTPFSEIHGVISPDGGWMAYASDETGRNEVYVQEFPKPRRKYQVSTDGAFRVWWRNDSKQLLILNNDLTQVLVADVQAGSDFSASRPRAVGRLSGQIVAVDATPESLTLAVRL